MLCGAALVAAQSATAAPAPSCATPGDGWCVARRISGDVAEGELGFRFGEPLDTDGDAHADIAVGTRLKRIGVHQNGMAVVWSGVGDVRLRAWEGEITDGLFGHWTLLVPDLGGDGLADLIIAAPNATVDGTVRGTLLARSPKSGEQIWKREGLADEHLGWDLSPAGDQNGDGCVDVFAGAPATDRGRAYLLSGRDGATLHAYAPGTEVPTFGWYVAALDDLDGDGHADLAVGDPGEKPSADSTAGGGYVFSATGKPLYHWIGPNHLSGFGEVVTAVGDLDGDGHGEVVVAAPRTNDHAHLQPGEVFIYSGASGTPLRHWIGAQPGELFGRMVVAAGDLNGDGVDDLAIGAPWHRGEQGERAGRVEFRSGKDGAVLGELHGDTADAWFGWHIRRARDPDGLGRPALLISSLREPVNGQSGVGVLELYVLRPVRVTEAR